MVLRSVSGALTVNKSGVLEAFFWQVEKLGMRKGRLVVSDRRLVDDIRSVLREHESLHAEAVGLGAPVPSMDVLADEWAAPGFGPESVREWCRRRCLDPQTACALITVGLGAHAEQVTTLGRGGPDTIAFKVMVGQLTLQGALVAAGVSTLLLDDESALGLQQRSDLAERVVADLRDLQVLQRALADTVTPAAAAAVIRELICAIAAAGQSLQRLSTGT